MAYIANQTRFDNLGRRWQPHQDEKKKCRRVAGLGRAGDAENPNTGCVEPAADTCRSPNRINEFSTDPLSILKFIEQIARVKFAKSIEHGGLSRD